MELMPCVLKPDGQQALIKAFYHCYFDTDQAVSDFGEEFFYVVGNIVTGHAPVKLEHLTDFEEIVCAASPGYKAAYESYSFKAGYAAALNEADSQ